MPPTFLVFVGALFYIPALALALAIGLTLLSARRTRLTGKRLIYASLGTAPALAVSCTIVAFLGLLAALAVSLLVRPWTEHGHVTQPMVALVLGYSFLVLFAIAGLFIAGVTLAGGRIGWRMAPGVSFRDVIATDPIVRRLRAWRGTMRS